MKKTLKTIAVLSLMLMLIICTVSCKNNVEPTGLWQSATYTEDTELGEGKTKIFVDVVAENQKITLTVNTDKENLGDALFEHSLINDASFFDTVIGIKADYSENEAWWKLCELKTENGEEKSVMLNFGADDAPISEGIHYQLIYTVGF